MDSQRDAKKFTDAFISYRRSDGSLLASLLKTHLKYNNFEAFLDVKNLGVGRFDESLLRNIEETRNFVLVLTPNALDRCIGDDDCEDWVHKEIKAALNSNCKIIPVFDSQFKWPQEDDLPADMKGICLYNGLRWDHENQEAVIDKLIRFIKGEAPELDVAAKLDVKILTNMLKKKYMKKLSKNHKTLYEFLKM
ncbi:NAD(+) hydrolase sarm1-like [Planococcus citri]|uniref:NAD(+) hydrolase sarm1-like n=1 Tax=Planococcus citri TaxID=170843 RepID=UPI0031F983AE